MTREPQCYLSYLLRLWQITSGGELVWRASLEDPRTGERVGFADLEAMFAFLRQRIGVALESDSSRKESRRE